MSNFFRKRDEFGISLFWRKVLTKALRKCDNFWGEKYVKPHTCSLISVLRNTKLKKKICVQPRNTNTTSACMRPEMKSTRIEFSTSHKRNSVYITFHCGLNEISFRGWSEKYGPFIKSQLCLFWWNKHMRKCFLSYNLISGSVHMTFYHLKWNFISVNITTMK